MCILLLHRLNTTLLQILDCECELFSYHYQFRFTDANEHTIYYRKKKELEVGTIGMREIIFSN